jgi:broad specificity phosphatase PhoE
MPDPTQFWLLRHALVERTARARLYGILDVPLCPDTLAAQAATAYRHLAAHLPRPAHWLVSPLSRTRATAQAIFAAGYPQTHLTVEPGMIEQNLGAWQGLTHAELPKLLATQPHPFWPLGPEEHPPGGETMTQVLNRVAPCLQRLATRWPGQHIVIVSHGGAIRAALAHALAIPAGAALHFAIDNLSLTRLEHTSAGWRVLGVNAQAD